MSHSLQPHNTFFSLRMLVSSTKATTEKRGCLQAEEGKLLSTLHRVGSTQSQGGELGHNPASVQFKSDPTITKLQHLQQPKTLLLKYYRMWGLHFPSLCLMYFAGLCTMLIYISDNFSWRIGAKEEAHSRHLGLLWEFSHNCKHSGNKIWRVR